MKIEQPGPDKFTELSDVPHSYAGAASKNVTVTIGENGLEFTPGGTGGGVQSVVAGTNITVDNTDPANPVVSSTASGGATIIETEVDFGTVGTDKPVTEKTFTVVNASITTSSKITATESGATATGRQDGDSLWDSITYACTPATGSFTLFAKASGSVIGKRKVNYSFA